MDFAPVSALGSFESLWKKVLVVAIVSYTYAFLFVFFFKFISKFLCEIEICLAVCSLFCSSSTSNLGRPLDRFPSGAGSTSLLSLLLSAFGMVLLSPVYNYVIMLMIHKRRLRATPNPRATCNASRLFAGRRREDTCCCSPRFSFVGM